MKRKHAELIHLWADGAEIEVLTGEGDFCPSWVTTRYPRWSKVNEYRLKGGQTPTIIDPILNLEDIKWV
jgi:hypothetical protein